MSETNRESNPMRPTKIRLINFKGRTGDWDFAPINVIVGENAAGKSAIAEAVKLAMLGYNLHLGKRNTDTAKLMSGSTMSVRLGFDNGRCNGIEMAENRGKVSMSQKLDVKFPSIALDASEYFSLTGPQRIKFLFDRLSGIEFDADTLSAKVRQIQGDPHTAVCEKVISDLCEDLDFDQKSEPLNEWFDNVIERWNHRGSEADYQAKLMKGSVGATTVLQATENAKPPRPGIENEIIARRAENEDLVQKITKLHADLDREKDEAEKAVQATANRQQAERARDLASGSMHGLTDPTAELTLAKTNLMQIRNSKPVETPAPGPSEETVHTKTDAIKERQKDLWGQIRQEEMQYKTDSGNKTCPTCGGRSPAWISKLKTRHEEKLAELKATIRSLGIDLKNAQADEKEAKERDTRNAKIQTDTQAFNTKIIAAQNSVQVLTEKKARWDALKTIADAPIPDVPTPFKADPAAASQLEILRLRRDELAIQIRELETEQKQAIAAQADARRRQEAQERLNSCEAEAKLCKLAVKIVREEQQEIIGKNIAAVMDKASLFIEPVMGWKVEFRDGEIGYVRKAGGWVTHETLSGTEQLLVYTGLCAAFSQGAPSRIVIMDELGRLSYLNKTKLIGSVKKMVKTGLLDCFIGIDTTPGDWQGIEGVSVIEVR